MRTSPTLILLPPDFLIVTLGILTHGVPAITLLIDGSWDHMTQQSGYAWVRDKDGSQPMEGEGICDGQLYPLD